MDCLFCEIANKNIPSTIVYEDEKIIAFEDISPQAPVHVLIIAKSHFDSLDTLDDSDETIELMGYILTKVKNIAAQLGINNGYRLVCNCGEDGQQTVNHIHFHLLGKRQMDWPPG